MILFVRDSLNKEFVNLIYHYYSCFHPYDVTLVELDDRATLSFYKTRKSFLHQNQKGGFLEYLSRLFYFLSQRTLFFDEYNQPAP